MADELDDAPDDLADLPPRPRTRGECADGPRPCPYVTCAYHLYLDVNPDTGAIRFNHGAIETMAETCALDVADKGGQTLDQVGQVLGLTRERIRQIEVRALLRMRRTNARASQLRGVLGEGD